MPTVRQTLYTPKPGNPWVHANIEMFQLVWKNLRDSMTRGVSFNSVETRLIVALLFLMLLPAISVGWIAHNLLYENIRSERIGDVGRIADAKHSQLVMLLTRANERATLFLENLGAQCGANAAKLDRDCAAKLIRSYLSAEKAMGATLHHKGSNDLKIGAYAPGHTADLKFQTGQLATFSGTGPANNRSYFISVAEQSGGLQLEVSYPSSNLQPIFDHPAALGESGETFLTDAEGYFVTEGRYSSTQGHSHPIDARPMQSCLRGGNTEVLDLDYRGAKVIHGFRLIPEFGSACIMAHIDQAEAFAPLATLERKLFAATSIFVVLAFLTARLIARKIAQPMVNLTNTARSIAQGDYTAKADVAGFGEIADLATAFNSMTQQLTAANAQLEQRSAELAHQRSFVRRVIDSDPNLIFVKDTEGRFLLANTAMAKSHGLPAHEITGKFASYFTKNPERTAAYDRAHREVLETRREQESIETARLADAQNHWFRIRRIPLLQGDGSTSVLTIAMDITAHKLAEQKLQDINRALRLLSECNALLLHAETEEHLLAEICAVLVKTGGYGMAWVGFAGHDKDKEVRPVAKYGFEEVYRGDAGVSRDADWGRGPAGSVIRSGVTQINQNAFGNSQMSPWRDAALKQGYRSSISLPLKDGARTFGVLSLYTAQTDTFNAGEIKLLEDIADKLAFGIAMQRLRVRHLHSVEALQQSEEKFRLLVEHLPQRIFVKDVNSTYLSCNKHYAQDRGIAQNDIAGKTDFDFHPQALAEKYREDDERVMASGKMEELVNEHILKGEQRFVHVIKIPFKGRDGSTLGVLGMYWDDTEHIQAENRLRRSEQRLAEAQRIAQLGSWELDLCTNLVTWSDEIYRILEIDPDGVGASYEAFLDTVHPDDRELVNNAFTESTRNNAPYDIVHRLRMKDGRVKFVHEKGETFYSEDGTPLRSVGTTHDVTERIAAEASRNQLSEAVRHSGEAIALADQNNRFVYVNPAFSRLFGYSLEEVSGKSVDDVIGVMESTSTQPNQVRATADQHGIFRGETLRRTKEGRIVPTLLTVSCVRDEHGVSTGYVANLFDLTERYQAEGELRCQKLFMGQVIDTDPNLIFVKDAAGKCLLVNQAMASHYGLTTQEMTGKYIQEVNPKPEQVLAILEADRKVIESCRELIETTASVRPNGKPQWFLTIKRPLVQADGTVAVLGIAVDITEQKLAEIKLANSYLELQRLSTHLENLREDERAKIARDLHDEMGAQLVALKMRVAWLASKLPAGIPRLAEEAEQISGLVADAIRAMHQIVTQLRPNLQEGFGFAETIEDYVNKFGQRNGIKCTLVFPEEELTLKANQRVSLFRILQESLNNIAKYAQASQVKVVFTFRDRSLSLMVKDNGIGFNPAANKEQCFGLLGIRERALMMGGKARISSTPGKGTRVSVTIPDFGLSEPA